MGFGAYDESEQENQNVEASDIETESEKSEDSDHNGDLDFTLEDTESAIERLKQIKGDEENEE